MEKSPHFEDFDDRTVYHQSQTRALNNSTENFVVEFGKYKAHIVFDLRPEDVKALLKVERDHETPIRWINIWGPNKQPDLLDLLGDYYKFSPRLLAVIKTAPPLPEPRIEDKSAHKYRTKPAQKDDVELAASSLDSPRTDSSLPNPQTTSHYTIAKTMLHYQSIDVGTRYLCIGANWMHEVSNSSKDFSIDAEGKQRPLWSWLVLCDDNTVLSLHEDTGPLPNEHDLKTMRNNTLSVLSQLSNQGHLKADPISIQSVRQALELDSPQTNLGIEGASNLFYYLFDDWRAVYATIGAFRLRLKELQTEILEDMTRKSNKAPNIEIIPRLHILGRQIRQMQHLYKGYENLTQRILEPKATTIHNGAATPRSFTGLAGGRGVVLAQSAGTRFERLGDRLNLMMLSQTEEFLAEKEALISTYFNINAQKDSEATARLTRSATLLAKLSVLFLPVSLMTSYFSVQIPDLANKYTGKDYWYTFAVIMSLSFLALFFFSRLLMYVTETLDGWIKEASKLLARMLFKRRANHADEGGHGHEQ